MLVHAQKQDLMKWLTVRAATNCLLVMAFVACWSYTHPATRSSPLISNPRSVAAAAPVAAAPRPARNPQPVTPSLPAPRPANRNAQPAPLPALSAFTNFSYWAEQFLAGAPSASLAEGQAAAWKRREALRELIAINPQQALTLAAPFRWRTSLPASVTRFLETQVDGRGDYEVAMADAHGAGASVVYRWAVIGGQRYEAFVYGRRTTQLSRRQSPLHGIALDGKLALLAEPIRVLDADEAVPRTSGRPHDETCRVCGKSLRSEPRKMAGDIGGETAVFCGEEHLALVNARWVLTESGHGVTANAVAGGGDTRTQGRKTLLYLRVNFPDDLTEPLSAASAYHSMHDVNAFYVEGSYDTTSLTTEVTPLLTLPQVKAWYTTAGPGALLGDARETARKAGFDTRNYDLDIVSHTTVPRFDWGGLGFVGGKGTWLQSYGAGVAAHELGHNYGLMHANFWDTTTNGAAAIGPGFSVEYGNSFDTMGAAAAGANHFGALFKNSLGWLPDSAVHSVASNGVYRIYAFDTPQRTNGRLYAAKVHKDYGRDYWLEFRQAFPRNVSMQNGLLLNWSPWSASSGGTDLLDTTPGTLTKADAALVIGRTFSDVPGGIHLTPVARGATGTAPWIDVQVNLGTFPANWAPFLQVEMDPTNATPGGWVHFHATATDLDGDTLAYAWSFDDGSFSTNNLPWTSHAWGAPGEHVVRCMVSDMKGGIASANTIVPVGKPTGFRLSGIILDANDDPIEGVRVDNGITNTAGYVSSYTDSDGGFVLTGLAGEITLEATKYGYTFTNATWENPIQVSSNLLQVNFLAQPITWVSLSVSTDRVLEGSPQTGQLVLTRTGGTNDDLAVSLQVSGTARVGLDLSFNPPLSVGSNQVVIPAGTNRLVFDFTPVNDSIAEATEVASITILDDPAFYIAPLAEVQIKVLADDPPSLPGVSVSLANPFIPEIGADDFLFVFSRTGKPTGDLPVYYSVSGTATAGKDFPTLLGVVVIPAGQASAMVAFRPIDDKDVEPDETVTLTVSSDLTYTSAGSSATATIVDDDILVVTVAPTRDAAAEPTVSGAFTVKRDGDLTGNLVVYYSLSGTASNGVDYVTLSGAVTIPAGETTADVTLTPKDDTLTEGDESVVLTLLANPGYNVGNPAQAALFIRDNELATVTITADVAVASEPGLDFGKFRISRGSVVNGNLAVYLAINGTAIPGADYVPLDSMVIIPDGKSSVSLDLIPFDDLHVEPTEDVILTLLPSTNYNIGSPGQARVQILDNDDSAVPAVGFSFAASARLESEAPEISVSLSATSSAPVTVSYRIIGGTASTIDYRPGPGSLTFAPGELAKALPIEIVSNAVAEADRTLRIALYDPVGATHDGIRIHTFTILDDDTSSVSVLATANASERGAVPGYFRLTRTGGISSNLLVNFQITGTASAPADYAPLGTSATFPAGVASVDLPVMPVNDGIVELDETVVITLISAPGAKIVSPATASLTIFDTDPNGRPIVSISSTNRPYAVEGGGNGEFVFTRSSSSTGALTVDLRFSGTASSEDYEPLPGSITIPAGQVAFTLPVIAVDDNLIEGEETLIAAVTVRDTYRVSFSASATVTIQDNDQNVRVDASDLEAAEPGTDRGAFTFTRFGTTTTPLEVFFTIGGTASNGVDYVALPSSFVIPAGSLAATLPVMPLDDRLVEGPEVVTLTLVSDPSYTLATPTTATVTILDDEPMFRIVAYPMNVLEGSQQPGFFTVLRSGNPAYEVTARLRISGTATYGVDYPPFQTNIFFNCGVTAIAVQVFPTNELVVEEMETVIADLVPDPAYTILAPSNAVITIQDAGTNLAPTVTLTSPTSDLIFLLGTNVNIILEATATDDGDTNTPLTLSWTNVSGPCPMIFGDTNQASTTASFTNGGVYVLRFIADDGQASAYAEVTVVVDTLARLSTNLLHWSFDDGSGTNVLDSSGYARDGVVLGKANWATNGALGGALELSGTNSLVREAVDSALLNGRKQFSLTLWTQSEATNPHQGLFTADASGTNTTLTLAARTLASCGASSNTIEATFASSRGEAHHVSASNQITNGWQHLALTWSNGLAPAMYINGQVDQPFNAMVPLRGRLTNCPQFIIGKGPADILNSWKGWVDDVRVFPRALSAAEVAAFTATNFGAVVWVPTNLTVQVLTPVEIFGRIADDGRPIPPGTVSITWTQTVGPAVITLTNASALTNVLEFTQSGNYVFRFIADDGQVKVYADLPVTVVPPTQVSCYASDGEAAELGPDTGEITFSREGGLDFDLTIHVAISGTASNGVDFVQIPLTDTVILPAGTQSVAYVITPFLDHRTEGDETFTCTIISNVAYTITSGECTVMIHDSPYGMWTIDHFTIEELTDPSRSSEAADFDHDGLLNLAEYAVNRDPKASATNSPLAMSIELDLTHQPQYVLLTYLRRIEPTDVNYDVAVSSDLVTWHTGTNYVEELQATPDGNNLTETVKARLVAPVAISTNQFVTVRVWLRATGP